MSRVEPQAGAGGLRRRRALALALLLLLVPFSVGLTLAHVEERSRPAVERGWLVDAGAAPRNDLLAADRVDLSFARGSRVNGFFGSPNLAPGDVVRGEVTLAVDRDLPPEAFWLDVDVDVALDGDAAHARLDEALRITRLDYGGAPLLGDARVVAILDADGDGLVALRDLAAGLPRLAPPAARGTPFRVEAVFSPEAAGDGSAFAGQSVALTFRFHLRGGSDGGSVLPPAADPAPPGPPRAPKATPTSSGVLVSWQPPAGAGSSHVAGYVVERAGPDGVFHEIARVTGTELLDASAAPGTAYQYRVAAYTTATESGFTAPVSVPAAAPAARLALTPASPDGADGWYRTPVTATLSTEPAAAVAWYSLGDGPARDYTAPLTLATGVHTLRHWAEWEGRVGGADETTVRVDADPPRVGSLLLSATSVASGRQVVATATAHDVGGGIADVRAALVSPQGRLDQAMRQAGGAWSATFRPEAPGAYRLEVEARDAAGNRVVATGPTVSVVGAGEAPPSPSPGRPDRPNEVAPTPAPREPERPVEGTSTTGSPRAPTSSLADQARGPGMHVAPLDGKPLRLLDGVRGTLLVRVENVQDLDNVIIVLVHPDGTETILAVGTAEVAWDTTTFANGYYRIDTRILQEDGTYLALASRTVLVRNVRHTPVQVAAAAGLGVAAAVATDALRSGRLAPRAAGRGLGLAKLLQALGVAAGERLLRHGATSRLHRLPARAFPAAAVAVAVLGLAFAFEGAEPWSLRAYAAALPFAAAAAFLVFATFYSAEVAIARVSGAKARFRLLLSGLFALVATGLLFRQCFGYAGFVQKEEAGQSPAHRRLAAGRVVAVSGLVLGTCIPFVLVGSLWRFELAEWGLTIALTVLATSTMPVRPLPGWEVWRWRRLAAIILALASWAVFLTYEVGLLPLGALLVMSGVGLLGYGVGFLVARRAGRRLAAPSAPAAPSEPAEA